MSKYVVVLPLMPLTVGEGFAVEEWPLHVTLVPNFTTTEPLADIASALEAACHGVGSLTAAVGQEELFGPEANVRVNLVVEDARLHSLHETLVSAFEPLGAAFDVPEYLRAGYRPHVTVSTQGSAHPGDRLHLRQIALVNMEPAGVQQRREVVWTIDLPLPDARGGLGRITP